MPITQSAEHWRGSPTLPVALAATSRGNEYADASSESSDLIESMGCLSVSSSTASGAGDTGLSPLAGEL